MYEPFDDGVLDVTETPPASQTEPAESSTEPHAEAVESPTEPSGSQPETPPEDQPGESSD